MDNPEEPPDNTLEFEVGRIYLFNELIESGYVDEGMKKRNGRNLRFFLEGDFAHGFLPSQNDRQGNYYSTMDKTELR